MISAAIKRVVSDIYCGNTTAVGYASFYICEWLLRVGLRQRWHAAFDDVDNNNNYAHAEQIYNIRPTAWTPFSSVCAAVRVYKISFVIPCDYDARQSAPRTRRIQPPSVRRSCSGGKIITQNHTPRNLDFDSRIRERQ